MEESRKNARRGRITAVIAVLALLIAVGHVVYPFIRDHSLDCGVGPHPGLPAFPLPQGEGSRVRATAPNPKEQPIRRIAHPD